MISGDDIRDAFDDVDAIGFEHVGELSPWLEAHGIEPNGALAAVIDRAVQFGATVPHEAAQFMLYALAAAVRLARAELRRDELGGHER